MTDEKKTKAPIAKISSEVAAQEFGRFVSAMDLDVDESKMTNADKVSLNEARAAFIGAVMTGALVVDDNGQPIFVPQRSANTDPITFHEPTGASLMAMDTKKKDADITKTYAILADITRQPVKVFAAMQYPDLKICLAVMGLFLG